MQPVAAAARWGLPAIESVGALCDWLQLELEELEWFADLRGLGYGQSDSRLQHYHYKVLAKRSGDLRLIEAPKQRLKEMQRRILAEILERIPVHPAVHGFRKGHSIKSFVSPHVQQSVVLRMDVRNFFPSFHGPRIQAFFRMAGYPESVADLLGGVCTNAVPRGVWDKSYFDFSPEQLREAWSLYARPHLPQGAPTSPMLANLCAYRIDCRLSGLAASAGASTRAMPTIWLSLEMKRSAGMRWGFQSMWRLCCSKRDFMCIIARLALCTADGGSTLQGLSPMKK